MKKIKIVLTVLCVVTIGLFLLSSVSVALTIDANDLTGWTLNTDYWTGCDPMNPDADDIEIIVGYGGDLLELYKQDQGVASDEGPFASSYITSFYNTPTDPEDALIEYIDGEDYIAGDPLYLLVKDGRHIPCWYIFDISDWNGIDDIELLNFWVGGGAISHVSIYGPTTSVPEPTTILLIGSGLIGLWAFRRKFKK